MANNGSFQGAVPPPQQYGQPRYGQAQQRPGGYPGQAQPSWQTAGPQRGPQVPNASQHGQSAYQHHQQPPYGPRAPPHQIHYIPAQNPAASVIFPPNGGGGSVQPLGSFAAPANHPPRGTMPQAARGPPTIRTTGASTQIAPRRGRADSDDGAASDDDEAGVAAAARENAYELHWCSPLDHYSACETIARHTGCGSSGAVGRVTADGERERSVQDDFGRGVSAYFMYVVFLGAINLALSVPAIIQLASASASGHVDTASDVYSGVGRTFAGAHTPAARGGWVASTVVMLVMSMAAGPVYYIMHRQYQSYFTGKGRAEELQQGLDIIEDNRGYTHSERSWRRTASVLLTACVVALQGVLMWLLNRALVEVSSDSVTAIALSALLAVSNVVWKSVVRFLTSIEVHATRTSEIEWDSGKVFFVRIFNLLSLYLVKQLTGQDDVDEGQCTGIVDNDCRCPLSSMAYQFFWLIIMEITINNLIEIAIPYVMVWANQAFGLTDAQGTNAARQPFDLAEEYTALLYRQCVVYLGVSVFPLMPIMAVAASVIEYWLDKYKLVALSIKPRELPEPVRPELVLGAHIIIALVATFSFPNGTVLILAGFAGIGHNCAFFA